METPLSSPAYLPEGYQFRRRRVLADADPKRAREGWHDEHWDGRVTAVPRPGTVTMVGTKIPEGGIRIKPLDDPIYKVMAQLREVERMREKLMLRDTMGGKILGAPNGIE